MSRALHDVANGTLFGVALNYQGLLNQRLAEFEQAPYQKPPVKPVLFIKTPNTRNGHHAVVSTEDRALSPELQRWMYKRAGSKVTEIKASHSVYISQPEAVAKVIEDAASVIK